MSGAFPDTNVLLYAFDAGPKCYIAQSIVEGGGYLSVQSLNEFVNVARRKLGFDWPDIHRAIEALASLWKTLPLDVEMQRDAMRIAERYRLSIYDAMIIAAALSVDCDILYSEDMHDGLVIDGRLRIINPFAAA